MSDPALLARATDRLRNVPGFMAFELDRYRRVTHVDPVEDFGLPASSLAPLGLCRLPRRENYADDVTAIASQAITRGTRSEPRHGAVGAARFRPRPRTLGAPP